MFFRPLDSSTVEEPLWLRVTLSHRRKGRSRGPTSRQGLEEGTGGGPGGCRQDLLGVRWTVLSATRTHEKTAESIKNSQQQGPRGPPVAAVGGRGGVVVGEGGSGVLGCFVAAGPASVAVEDVPGTLPDLLSPGSTSWPGANVNLLTPPAPPLPEHRHSH